jgi:hypothetical protein
LAFDDDLVLRVFDALGDLHQSGGGSAGAGSGCGCGAVSSAVCPGQADAWAEGSAVPPISTQKVPFSSPSTISRTIWRRGIDREAFGSLVGRAKACPHEVRVRNLGSRIEQLEGEPALARGATGDAQLCHEIAGRDIVCPALPESLPAVTPVAGPSGVRRKIEVERPSAMEGATPASQASASITAHLEDMLIFASPTCRLRRRRRQTRLCTWSSQALAW